MFFYLWLLINRKIVQLRLGSIDHNLLYYGRIGIKHGGPYLVQDLSARRPPNKQNPMLSFPPVPVEAHLAQEPEQQASPSGERTPVAQLGSGTEVTS